MAIQFQEWIVAEEQGLVEAKEGTAGGTTYYLSGDNYCYNFTRSHYRAVRALTDDATIDYLEIQDREVERLVSSGAIRIDESDCWEGYGYLGCKVWDGETDEFVGTIGTKCSNYAGFGTEHLGTGRCKAHGGSKIANRLLGRATTGLTSKYLRKAIEDKIDAYMADPAPLDLSREIATSRAMLEFLSDWILDQGDVETFVARVPGLLSLIDNVGRLVDRAAMIEKRYAMTAAQVLYVERVFVDLINQYIPDPAKREQVALEMVRRLGSAAQEVNLALSPMNVRRGSYVS